MKQDELGAETSNLCYPIGCIENVGCSTKKLQPLDASKVRGADDVVDNDRQYDNPKQDESVKRQRCHE